MSRFPFAYGITGFLYDLFLRVRFPRFAGAYPLYAIIILNFTVVILHTIAGIFNLHFAVVLFYFAGGVSFVGTAPTLQVVSASLVLPLIMMLFDFQGMLLSLSAQ